MVGPLPLEGLFRCLVRRGFPLSVRDYEDALAALRQGHGLLRRDRLQWLCTALWARDDEQRALLARLFRELAVPTLEDIAALTGERLAGPLDAAPDAPAGAAARSARGQDDAPAPLVHFEAPGTAGGLGLPRAQVPASALQPHVFTPRPAVGLRSLVVAWRRFRVAQRSGPKVDLDIDASVAEQGRSGLLAAPVMVAARRNRARLVVLFDASPSMVPWQGLGSLVAQSLELGQLGHAALYWFNNDPCEGLFGSPALTRPLGLDDAAARHPDCRLLVVSDAGAARGRADRARARGTANFAAWAARRGWQPLVWANPLPRRRWAGTSAQRIAQLPGLRMTELNEEGLVRAVDQLRGKAG